MAQCGIEYNPDLLTVGRKPARDIRMYISSNLMQLMNWRKPLLIVSTRVIMDIPFGQDQSKNHC